MENQSSEENYHRDLNANPNDNVDDEPCPPPGLSRLVTGQTFSFDDGPSSPPFDRVIPGGSEPLPMFPPAPKKSGYPPFANDHAAVFGSSQDFFDSYLRNSSAAADNDSVAAGAGKNKFASQYFTLPEAAPDRRETFLQQDAAGVSQPHLQHRPYDGAAAAASAQLSFAAAFKQRPTNQPPLAKMAPKGPSPPDNVYETAAQPPPPAGRADTAAKFDPFVGQQHENDQTAENRETPHGHPLNSYAAPPNSYAAPPNSYAAPPPDRERLANFREPSSSDRMAIEGSCEPVAYPKPVVPASTPMQSPKYDFWYENDPSNSFREHPEMNNAYAADDGRPKRDSGFAAVAAAAKYEKTNPQAGAASAAHFAPQPGILQPQQLLQPPDAGVRSKTPSISSNTSSMNEAGYQQEKFMAEQKQRVDHFGNSEVLDGEVSAASYALPEHMSNKQILERPAKLFDIQPSDNDFVNDPRQLQRLDINRESFENNDDDRENSHYSDSDEGPIGKRTVLGHNNTIPRTRKNMDRPIQDTRTGKQYSYDTSHIKGNKREPLEQRLVLGETSSDAPVVQNAVRTRDDRPYYDDKVKRAGKESLSGRSDRSRKKPSHDGRDRRRYESDDDDDGSDDRGYDGSRRNHDLHRRGSPRRREKRPQRRHPDDSFAPSQDESVCDDDGADNYSYWGPHNSYNWEKRTRREPPPSHRSFYYDPYLPDRNLYGRYEDNLYYGVDRNLRPASRGSEVNRSHKSYLGEIRYDNFDARVKYALRFLDVCNTGDSQMPKNEVIYWLNVRDEKPSTYMHWFKDRYPKHYAAWYNRYVEPWKGYQADRRGSGHSGQSSVNNDTLSVNEDRIYESNESPMLKTSKVQVNSVAHEDRQSPVKFNIPHAKGVFNCLGQLVEVNACSPQDGQVARIDIKKLVEPKDADWIEFFSFTGPFIPGETHVHTVSRFLKHHADSTSNSSKKLLYLLIDLIIKLRGVTDGIAVSELLTASHAESQRPNHRYERGEDLLLNGDHQSRNEAQIIEEYTNLLLQGNKNSALELAVNNKLWGHAFLLASNMGKKYYSNVLAKFDASIAANNPLKTLYQLHSNQIPLAVTACSDEKWGDWRPHLAMILSNPTSESDLNRTSIVTLGDSLAPKDIYAAHFCYLVAEMDFDPPNKPGSKFPLLSLRNNADNLNGNTPNHAILLTQTYEFAKRLQRKDFIISALLPYKYLLATRLLDYNRSSVALQYLESIALDLMKHPSNENYDLMYNVLELSERIKYSDSKPLIADSGDKQWLTSLRQLVDNFASSSRDPSLCSKPWQPDQSYQVPSFQQTPLVQPLPPQISPLTQQSPHSSPIEEPQPPLFYQPSPISKPPSLLPAPSQNSSWENPSFQQNSLDITSSSGFIQSPVNKSVDINDNISAQPSNDYSLPSSDYQQQDLYNPWVQQQPPISISMRSSNNYFNDSTKSLNHENAVKNRVAENQTAAAMASKPEKDENGEKQNENGRKGLLNLFNFWRDTTPKAKLPDDKNMDITFDETLQQWVDKKNQGAGMAEPIKPPPMAADFRNVQKVDNESNNIRANPTFYDQNTLPGPPAAMRPAGNVYSLSRGKGMKANYVNVLANNSSAARPPNLPTPPSSS